MELHIIHLKHRTDRWKLLQEELRVQNIKNYRIWDGVLDESCPPNFGIAKAHKQVIQFAKETKKSSILIAQDDIKFTAPTAFQYFLSNIPSDYDLYLGSIYFGKIKKDKTVDDFAGLTLFLAQERFYDVFLSLPENCHLDRALKLKGKFVVCEPFVAIQHNGYSDNRRVNCSYDLYLKNRKLFGVK